MKKMFVYLAMLVCIVCSSTLSAQINGEEYPPGEPLKLYFSPDLQRVAAASIAVFSAQHTEIRMNATAIEKPSYDAWYSDEKDLALVSEKYLRGLQPDDVSLTLVGREVYIPVMNPANPCMERIRETGIAPGEFARVFAAGDPITWGNIAGNECSEHVHAYIIDDRAFLSYLANFTGNDPKEIGGDVKNACKEVMEAVKSDRLAVGFCRLDQLMELQRTGDTEGVVMIPVDRNENNSVDHFEDIYGDVDALARGIWIGKYPAALCNKIYAVARKDRQQGVADKFIYWMVTGGQEVMASNGYTGLMENEQATFLASLDSEVATVPQDEERKGNILLLVLGLVVLTAVLGVYGFRLLNRRVKIEGEISVHSGNEGSTGVEYAPGGYFVDKSHTWVYMEKNGVVRIGIDNFMQHITGKITRIGMKHPGDKVKKGEVLLTLVQHGKNMELRSPVSGVISGTNDLLQKEGGSVNNDPYGTGWICLIEPSNWEAESSSFFRGKEYAGWIKDEIARLKDFIAEKLQKMIHGNIQPVFQEGGELRAGLLEDLGPEAWEEFQTGFLHKK